MSENTIFWEYVITNVLVVILKIVCFILGYLTIRLGQQLIGSGVKGEFKFSAKLSGVSGDLVSASPGLLFVLLGIFLISFAIFVNKGAVQTLEIHRTTDERPKVEVPKSSEFPSKGKGKL